MIFNNNTLKISYSCISKISKIISGHSKNLLNPTATQYGCNYQIKKFRLDLIEQQEIKMYGC